MVQQEGREPQPKVAGLVNAGSDMLQALFRRNLPSRRDETMRRHYHVAVGQHVAPTEYWLSRHRDPDAKQELFRQSFPVVVIRDPFRWMQQMCKNPLKVQWNLGEAGRCPNLIPTEQEQTREVNQNINSTFSVTVPVYGKYIDRYDSLAAMWSKWNRVYTNATFPRLMVRYEDLLFHGEKVLQIVCDCVGMPLLHENYVYPFGQGIEELVSLLAAEGMKDENRHSSLTVDELRYLEEALDPKLMQIFGYAQSPTLPN